MALLRRCSICGKKVEYGKKCTCEVEREKKKYREYNIYTRNSKDNIKYTRFYKTGDWIRLSEHIKNKYNGMCLICLLEKEEIVQADVVHHIVPIRMGYSKRLRKDNVIPLCHTCHNSIDHSNVTGDDIRRLERLLKLYEVTYG